MQEGRAPLSDHLRRVDYIISSLLRLVNALLAGSHMTHVLGGAQHDDGMQHLRRTLLTQIVDALRPAITTAVDRGLLRDDVTAETFAMTTVGPLVYQRFLVGARLGHDTVDAVVDAVLRAWAP
ncbi:TetR-like C-terminal domain-containing protein [Streptomyces sp. NPDC013157]|uniref:TetR-like C-terminal domain-containing protein n=1 Tax=Streptomyces sp. NPDC013157 TaxID=3364861 RepID=UPI0036C2C67F